MSNKQSMKLYTEEQVRIMLYCIEIDRGGIGEEDMVLHHNFETKPTREDVLKVIKDEECNYDDNYCKFNYYQVS